MIRESAIILKDRFYEFTDFVFTTESSPFDFLKLLDELVDLGLYVERSSPTSVKVSIGGLFSRSGEKETRMVHHLDFSSFPWHSPKAALDVVERLVQGRDETLVLNHMIDSEDYEIEPSLLHFLVPCLT